MVFCIFLLGTVVIFFVLKQALHRQEEINRLRSEQEEINRLRSEQEEMNRLRPEQEEMNRLRSEQEEMNRLRSEQEDTGIIRNEALYAETERARRISKYRHDLANHIRTLEALPADAGKPEILKALYLIKQDTCRENGIRVTSKIDPQGWEELSKTGESTELVSLLSNLFDNAIEAVLRIPDPAQRYIAFRLEVTGGKKSEGEISGGELSKGKNEMKIIVENPYDKVPDFQTVKADRKMHGMGLPIIREMIERKDGRIMIDTKDHVCRITCCLPGKN